LRTVPAAPSLFVGWAKAHGMAWLHRVGEIADARALQK
jgi:hypothetical protein